MSKKKIVVGLDVKVWAAAEVTVEASSNEDAENQVRALLKEKGVNHFRWLTWGPSGEEYVVDPRQIVDDDGGAEVFVESMQNEYKSTVPPKKDMH